MFVLQIEEISKQSTGRTVELSDFGLVMGYKLIFEARTPILIQFLKLNFFSFYCFIFMFCPMACAPAGAATTQYWSSTSPTINVLCYFLLVKVLFISSVLLHPLQRTRSKETRVLYFCGCRRGASQCKDSWRITSVSK